MAGHPHTRGRRSRTERTLAHRDWAPTRAKSTKPHRVGPGPPWPDTSLTQGRRGRSERTLAFDRQRCVQGAAHSCLQAGSKKERVPMASGAFKRTRTAMPECAAMQDARGKVPPLPRPLSLEGRGVQSTHKLSASPSEAEVRVGEREHARGKVSPSPPAPLPQGERGAKHSQALGEPERSGGQGGGEGARSRQGPPSPPTPLPRGERGAKHSQALGEPERSEGQGGGEGAGSRQGPPLSPDPSPTRGEGSKALTSSRRARAKQRSGWGRRM
jgi:hypothetical protein